MSLARSLTDAPVYLATARKWDKDFEKRIARHQNDRDDSWENLEEEKHIGSLNLSGRVVVIDCVTLWLTNWFSDLKMDIDSCLRECKRELDLLCQQDSTLIFISNEIGMGGHAHSEAGRKFTELQGWINQHLAEKSDKAVMMVSGLPMILK